MLDYFLSSDWAIIATELLAGFFVITTILAVLLWRGQRSHTGAAERLLDDRDPILKATEEMVERQIQRIWPEIRLDDEQREIYAERSLDAVEAMVEPWLEPKRHDLSSVARQFQRVRQEDLEQLLTLARAHAEATQADDERVAELEQEIGELRTQRDRQANHLNESLETVNVMVREYGRKFDYNEEPHVAAVLKAIVMIQEMEAGADCETAQQRAENIFSEDLVASTAPIEETAPAESSDASAEAAAAEPEAPDAAEQMAAAMEMESAASAESEGIDVGGEQTGRREATEAASSGTPETATSEPADSEAPDSGEATATPSPETDANGGDEDIDALIAQAQDTQAATSAASEAVSASEDAVPAPTVQEEPDSTTTAAGTEAAEPRDQADEPAGPASAAETASASEPAEAAQPPGETPAPADTPAASESAETAEPTAAGDEDGEDNGVIDLDDVEIPEEEQETSKQETNEFDLDDIDALLDAEIAKKHGKSQE